MYRKHLSFGYSKARFCRTARKTNTVNLSSNFVPRGGFRL